MLFAWHDLARQPLDIRGLYLCELLGNCLPGGTETWNETKEYQE